MSARNTYQVATYLPLDVADQLKAVANRQKWSLAQTMKISILEFLEREKEKETVKKVRLD
jgi:hypothetical protein